MQTLPDFDSSSSDCARDCARQDLVGSMASDNASDETVRREIARELHDTVIQPLAALVVGLRMQYQSSDAATASDDVCTWQALAQEALDALRAILGGLRTHLHAPLGLPDALRQHLIPQFRAMGLDLQVESKHWPPELPSEWTSSLYLVVREAVTNAEKHGHASQVFILMRADAQHLWVEVTDNGTGFSAAEVGASLPAPAWSGFGLQSMRDRVRGLGGHLRVKAAPDCGTHMEACIPIPDRVPPPSPDGGQRGGSGELGSCLLH